MGTYNKMMFDELIQKYKKSNQVRVEEGKLEILEKDKKKKQQILWELAEYNTELTLQLLT